MQFYSVGSLSRNVLCLLFFSSVWAAGDPSGTCDFEEDSCIWEVGEVSQNWKWERFFIKVKGLEVYFLFDFRRKINNISGPGPSADREGRDDSNDEILSTEQCMMPVL